MRAAAPKMTEPLVEKLNSVQPLQRPLSSSSDGALLRSNFTHSQPPAHPQARPQNDSVQNPPAPGDLFHQASRAHLTSTSMSAAVPEVQSAHPSRQSSTEYDQNLADGFQGDVEAPALVNGHQAADRSSVTLQKPWWRSPLAALQGRKQAPQQAIPVDATVPNSEAGEKRPKLAQGAFRSAFAKVNAPTTTDSGIREGNRAAHT